MSKRLVALFTIVIVAFFLNTSSIYAKTGEAILTTAKEQLGTPYQFGGSSPGGFDCSGFIYYVFAQNGIMLPRISNDQYVAGVSVKKSDLQVGDLVFFQTYAPGPSHSGIYVGNGQFIHASSSKGISYASINDPYYWGSKYLGARRVLSETDVKALSDLKPGEYLDVDSDHWAYNSIKTLSNEGVISGLEEGLFKPNETVTRAQAASTIAKLKGLTSNKSVNFTDVSSNHWALNDIVAATEAGYFNATDKFEPNRSMTRAELADFVARAFEIKDANSTTTFKDVNTNHWAYNSISKVSAHNIMNGFKDDTYRPNEQITRAQFSSILFSVLEK